MHHACLAWSGWLVALLLVMTGWVTRHDDRPADDDEAAIDATYERFSQAYAAMDAQRILDLYTDDAYYLIGSAARILHGKEDLALAFSTLEGTKEKGGQLAIEFRVVDRTIQGDRAYDVGYYKLTTTVPNGETNDTASKFVTILKKQADGSWRFQVDHHSNAMLQAFDKVGSE